MKINLYQKPSDDSTENERLRRSWKIAFFQACRRPPSGPGRQASSSPGCTCNVSSIMQRAQERAGSLSVPDEMGFEKKPRLRLREHRERHEFGQSPGAAPRKRHDEVLPHGDEEGSDPVGRPEDGLPGGEGNRGGTGHALGRTVRVGMYRDLRPGFPFERKREFQMTAR